MANRHEESATLRAMNALRAHAQDAGSTKTPVMSASFLMLGELTPASNDMHIVASLHAAGFDVVPYTVNDKPTMQALLKLRVDGIISDRTDLLYQAIEEHYDQDGKGAPSDFLLPDGTIDRTKIDAQGHKGSQGLRPENTLPAVEAGLNDLMTTLETDTGISADGIPVLNHDPQIQSAKCRKADGNSYGPADEVLIKDLTAAQISSTFICDKLLGASFPEQNNDRRVSPATAAFKQSQGLPDECVMPKLGELFDYVAFYIDYYSTGAGATDPKAPVRVANAQKVRFNIETKVNPRAEFASLMACPETFVNAVGGEIASRGLEDRADIQSFDWRTLLLVHERFPTIRTVALFGDFPRGR